MTDFAASFFLVPDPGSILLTMRQLLTVELRETGPRETAGPQPMRRSDAEIRREAARYVPAHLRRDVGLDPDIL